MATTYRSDGQIERRASAITDSPAMQLQGVGVADRPPTIIASVNRKYTGKLPKDSPEWERHTCTFQIEPLDAQGLADAIRRGHAISAAHHTRRCTDNFISAQHMGLDFDTEDEQSSIDALLADPFIDQHAAIVHTTSSHTEDAPRARVLFLLDAPVCDAAQYVRYVNALIHRFGISDKQCNDAARLWFGAEGCRIVVRQDKVLPLSVLDELVTEANRNVAARHEQSYNATYQDCSTLLASAINEAVCGTRNDTGFRLFCSLRDNGLTLGDALPLVREYQAAVEQRGSHPYTWEEALRSLRSAYSRGPRYPDSAQLEEELVLFEWFAWHQPIGAKKGGVHYSLKTVMAISELARRAGRTQHLDLPVREFIRFGVSKTTAGKHLKALCHAGMLVPDHKHKDGRAGRYSINIPLLRQLASECPPGSMPKRDNHAENSLLHDCPSMTHFALEQSATYHSLQRYDHFRHGARIDLRLWPEEPFDEPFGPAVQRMIATLVECAPASKAEWFHLSKVNARTGNRKAQLLQWAGVVTYDLDPEDERRRVPRLTENWHERLCEIEPALTTYGSSLLHAERADLQRCAHHAWRLKHVTGKEREVSEKALAAAEQRLSEYGAQKAELMRRRVAFANARGIRSVPPLSTSPYQRPQPDRLAITGPTDSHRSGRTVRGDNEGYGKRVDRNKDVESSGESGVPPTAARRTKFARGCNTERMARIALALAARRSRRLAQAGGQQQAICIRRATTRRTPLPFL